MSRSKDRSPHHPSITPAAEAGVEKAIRTGELADAGGSRLLTSRRGFLGCMAWAGTGVVWTRERRAFPARSI